MVLEGLLVVSTPFWLVDPFRRRWSSSSVRLMRQAGRAAFAAFVLHQLVLVGLVLLTHRLTHRLSWPPEADFLLVGLLGVLGSFGLDAILVRLPAARRVL